MTKEGETEGKGVRNDRMRRRKEEEKNDARGVKGEGESEVPKVYLRENPLIYLLPRCVRPLCRLRPSCAHMD